MSRNGGQQHAWKHTLPLSLCVLGGFVGGFISAYVFLPQSHARGFPIREKGYTYINPILGFEAAPESKDFEEFRFLADEIHRAVDSIEKHSGIQASVYFRALNSGRWVGEQENEEYAGASLLKVAAVIAYYKATETNPALLSKKFVWDGESKNHVKAQNVKPAEELRAGFTYTAEELTKRALVYSDNDAADLLSSALVPGNIVEIATDLNLPVKDGKIQAISPKSYSFLFRVLYGATYLPRNTSEKLLKMLSHSGFRDGLAKGVPRELAVANKFGERTFLSPNDGHVVTEVDFHDCGIIYYPGHPYFLCIMTKGHSFDSQIQAIASISRTVYEAMDGYWSAGNK